MAAEFDTRSIEATMATMTADPVVNHVPVMTGGLGSRQVRDFYTRYFIGKHPLDTKTRPPCWRRSGSLTWRDCRQPGSRRHVRSEMPHKSLQMR
jgi:hypothetical protein